MWSSFSFFQKGSAKNEKKKKKKKWGKNFLIELEKATQAAKYRLGQKKLRVCGYLTVPDKK